MAEPAFFQDDDEYPDPDIELARGVGVILLNDCDDAFCDAYVVATGLPKNGTVTCTEPHFYDTPAEADNLFEWDVPEVEVVDLYTPPKKKVRAR